MITVITFITAHQLLPFGPDTDDRSWPRLATIITVDVIILGRPSPSNKPSFSVVIIIDSQHLRIVPSPFLLLSSSSSMVTFLALTIHPASAGRHLEIGRHAKRARTVGLPASGTRPGAVRHSTLYLTDALHISSTSLALNASVVYFLSSSTLALDVSDGFVSQSHRFRRLLFTNNINEPTVCNILCPPSISFVSALCERKLSS